MLTRSCVNENGPNRALGHRHHSQQASYKAHGNGTGLPVVLSRGIWASTDAR